MYIKDHIIAWFAILEFSKTLWYISFHRVQNKQKGVVPQAFFFFFPTKATCQLRKASLTKGGVTQLPKHGCFGAVKEAMICGFNKHWPLLLSWSKVRILPYKASQAKKLTLIETQVFYTMPEGNAFNLEITKHG